MTHDPLSRSNRPAILLAEDDPDQSEMLSEILVAEGFLVDTAFSGETALHKLSNCTYALVILDVRMPGMYGSEVLRQFRMSEKDGRTPVMIVSAFATESEIRQYCLDGADASLSKPYEIQELVAVIGRLTRTSRRATLCSH
jgi:DNA-binding response OmpR family regulator